jgi:hypothetical protein
MVGVGNVERREVEVAKTKGPISKKTFLFCFFVFFKQFFVRSKTNFVMFSLFLFENYLFRGNLFSSLLVSEGKGVFFWMHGVGEPN